MKDRIKIEFDKYELGIIINALNEFKTLKLRNSNIEQNAIGFNYSDNNDLVQPINDLLIKVIDSQEKIRCSKKSLEAR